MSVLLLRKDGAMTLKDALDLALWKRELHILTLLRISYMDDRIV
ncbi:hypothetical protein [Candidatus Anaplasma sp. TIGMIC]|nr:hypothetical protein [Candidatus Anaplasma sp. TIGMIC]MDB1135195.1 hypothetical protein [Candidatus Anaplasma sp. TIGMIC]